MSSCAKGIFLVFFWCITATGSALRSGARRGPAERPAAPSSLFRVNDSALHELNVSARSGNFLATRSILGVARSTKREETVAKQPGLPSIFATLPQRCAIMRQYPPEPELCRAANSSKPRFTQEDMNIAMNYFVHMWRAYQNRFVKPCCTGLNHLFAVWFTVAKLKPLAIIEVGVGSGQQTWWLRTTSDFVGRKNIPIFSLDPIGPEAYNANTDSWVDDNKATTYRVGKDFVDVTETNWEKLLPGAGLRARTLVILSDHRNCVVQFRALQRAGFRSVLYMDNNPYAVSTSADSSTCPGLGEFIKRDYPYDQLPGDAYTPSAICDRRLPNNTKMVLAKDEQGSFCKRLTPVEHEINVKFMQANVGTYFEFPPVYNPCDGVQRKALLQRAEMPTFFPLVDNEVWKYGHLFPALVELMPPSKESLFPEPPPAPEGVPVPGGFPLPLNAGPR